jgi:hypothetical protein
LAASRRWSSSSRGRRASSSSRVAAFSRFFTCCSYSLRAFLLPDAEMGCQADGAASLAGRRVCSATSGPRASSAATAVAKGALSEPSPVVSEPAASSM